jgi:cell wall-associated NlpC family hydrolase
MNQDDFISMVIGKPWVNRSSGPYSYDCWGLVIKSFECIDGITLPTVAGYIEKEKTHVAAPAEAEKDWWIQSDGSDGDVACFYNHKGRFMHVGRVLAGGVAHSSGLEGVGAVKWEPKKVVSDRFHKTEYRKYANN